MRATSEDFNKVRGPEAEAAPRPPGPLGSVWKAVGRLGEWGRLGFRVALRKEEGRPEALGGTVLSGDKLGAAVFLWAS